MMEWLFGMMPVLIMASFGFGVSLGVYREGPWWLATQSPPWMLQIAAFWYGADASGVVAIGAIVRWPGHFDLWDVMILVTWLSGFAGCQYLPYLLTL